MSKYKRITAQEFSKEATTQELVRIFVNPRDAEIEDINNRTIELLDQGADINCRINGSLDRSILSIAARRRWGEVVKTLLDRGADIHSRNGITTSDDTVFMVAAAHCPLDVVQAFVERAKRDDKKTFRGRFGFASKNVDQIFAARDKNGRSALLMATQNPDTEVVKFFLDRPRRDGVSDELDAIGANILMYAAMSGNVDLVEDLLIRRSFAVNAINERGETALMYARGVEVIRSLVALGANLDMISKKEETALTKHLRNKEETELLLDLGADPRLRDTGGKCALDHFVSRASRYKEEDFEGCCKIIEKLIEKGAKPKARNSNTDTFSTIHQMLCLNIPLDVLSKIFTTGDDWRNPFFKNEVLITASELGRADAVELVLDGDNFGKNEKERNALRMAAIKNGNPTVLELVMKRADSLGEGDDIRHALVSNAYDADEKKLPFILRASVPLGGINKEYRDAMSYLICYKDYRDGKCVAILATHIDHIEKQKDLMLEQDRKRIKGFPELKEEVDKFCSEMPKPEDSYKSLIKSLHEKGFSALAYRVREDFLPQRSAMRSADMALISLENEVNETFEKLHSEVVRASYPPLVVTTPRGNKAQRVVDIRAVSPVETLG